MLVSRGRCSASVCVWGVEGGIKWKWDPDGRERQGVRFPQASSKERNGRAGATAPPELPARAARPLRRAPVHGTAELACPVVVI